MKKIFVSNIKINKVRHLKDIEIELSQKEIKHLIITGKNGSGKTSLLNSIATFLNSITNSSDPMEAMRNLEADNKNLLYFENREDNDIEIREIKERIAYYEKRIEDSTNGVMLKLNCPLSNVRQEFKQGCFVVAYYKADRVFKAQIKR